MIVESCFASWLTERRSCFHPRCQDRPIGFSNQWAFPRWQEKIMEGHSLARTLPPPCWSGTDWIRNSEIIWRLDCFPEHHAETLDWISLKGNHHPKSVLTPSCPPPPAKSGQTAPLVPCQGYNWHRRQPAPFNGGQGTILQRWASD